MSPRRKSHTVVVACIALALLTTACGSRRTYDDLLAADLMTTQSAGPTGQRAGTATGSSGDVGVAPADTSATGTSPTPGGSSGGSGTDQTTAGGPAVAAAPSTCTASLSPLILGSVGTQSGLIGSIVGDSVKAVQAWAASRNATGGIKCHPIKYVVADDGGDPGKHQALVQELVEQDHVIAFLQMDSVLTGQASVAYLSARGIPVIGSEGGSNWFNENPNYFPATSSGDATVVSVLAGAAKIASDNAAPVLGTMSCLEVSICSKIYDFGPSYASAHGLTLASRSQLSIVQPDFTAACQSAKQAGVQVLAIAMDGNSIQRIGRSCRSIGFQPIMIAQSLGLTASLPDDSDLDGLYGALITAPWVDTSNAVVADQDKAVRQYLPGTPPSSATVQGWVATKLFEDAVANVADPTSSQAILQGLWTVNNDDLGGTTYPLTFVQGQNAPKQFCTWLVQISGGKYVVPGDGSKTCGSL